MNNPDHTEKRLTDLEIKASFSEDLMDQLNAVIVRQQEDITYLLRELALVKSLIPHTNPQPSAPLYELPPHY